MFLRFLHPYDRSLIKAAIERELNRKGQVFIVQNNINKFYEIQDLLKDLIPKIKVGIAHGRLPKKDISKTDFVDYFLSCLNLFFGKSVRGSIEYCSLLRQDIVHF